MAFWRTYYHIAWATKERSPLITPDMENLLWELIREKSGKFGGIPHGVGGIEDHVHLVVSIPPQIAVSEFVGKIKGSTSHFLNHGNHFSRKKFAWQDGFGVFTLGEKQLDQAIQYVSRQREHHENKTIKKWLETFDKENADLDQNES